MFIISFSLIINRKFITTLPPYKNALRLSTCTPLLWTFEHRTTRGLTQKQGTFYPTVATCDNQHRLGPPGWEFWMARTILRIPLNPFRSLIHSFVSSRASSMERPHRTSLFERPRKAPQLRHIHTYLLHLHTALFLIVILNYIQKKNKTILPAIAQPPPPPHFFPRHWEPARRASTCFAYHHPDTSVPYPRMINRTI